MHVHVNVGTTTVGRRKSSDTSTPSSVYVSSASSPDMASNHREKSGRGVYLYACVCMYIQCKYM